MTSSAGRPILDSAADARKRLLNLLLDDEWSWRRRRFEVLEPATWESIRAKSTFEFCIPTSFFQTASKGSPSTAVPDGTKHIIPVARFLKVVPHELEVSDDAGRILPYLTRHDACGIGGVFLFNHLKEALSKCKPKVVYVGGILEYLLSVLAFMNPGVTADQMVKDLPKVNFDNCADPRNLDSFVAWLHEGIKPYLGNPDAAVSPKARQDLESHLNRMRPIAQKMAERDPRVVDGSKDLGKLFRNPIANPILLLKDHAKISQYEDAQFDTATQCIHHLLDMLTEWEKAWSALTIEQKKSTKSAGSQATAKAPTNRAFQELLGEISNLTFGWVVYVTINVKPDEPFALRLERIVPARWSNDERQPTFYGRWLAYALPYGDCMSTHVELTLPSDELLFGGLGRKTQIREAKGSFVDPRKLFGAVNDHSAWRIHLYTSRKDPIGVQPEVGTRHHPSTTLYVPVRVKPSIHAAYLTVFLGLLGLGVFAWALGGAVWNQEIVITGGSFQALATITGVAVALAILFAAERHRHRLVAEATRTWAALILTVSLLAVTPLLVALLKHLF